MHLKRTCVSIKKKGGSTMHSIGLGTASRISIIFSAPFGGSSILFLVLGSQIPMGSLFYPFIVGLIINVDFCLYLSM